MLCRANAPFTEKMSTRVASERHLQAPTLRGWAMRWRLELMQGRIETTSRVSLSRASLILVAGTATITEGDDAWGNLGVGDVCAVANGSRSREGTRVWMRHHNKRCDIKSRSAMYVAGFFGVVDVPV